MPRKKKDEERAGKDVAESEKELIDKAIQEFMLDNGFSDDKIHHHLRAEYDCFVERAGCRGNGHQSHGMTCLYRGMRPDRKNANELLYMQVGAFTTEEKRLKKYILLGKCARIPACSLLMDPKGPPKPEPMGWELGGEGGTL